jgi:N-acetylmuramoyl-L-alanine amidase
MVEKKIVLDISRRVAQRINGLRGYKAVLTRNRDVFLPLERRVDIAAAKEADAFVSIHLNSAKNRSARGVEIFFISPGGARVTASNVLSNPDRAASELGLSNSNNTDLLHMLVDVNQQSVMMRSEFLAEAILESMSKKGLPPTRTVKQKSFSVLRTIEMPSVLVEAGFLTNKNDAKLVRKEAGLQQVADAIANGIVSYFSNHPPPRGERKPAAFVHKVKKGESLWRISRRYGTTVAGIRRANNLNSSSVLWVGQELIINRY